MENSILKSFIEATVDTFETMVETTVEHKGSEIYPSKQTTGDLCALIGLSGDKTGNSVLMFSKDSGCKSAERFLGEDVSESPEDLNDAIGELINIIAGQAKSTVTDMKLSISLPSVMSGDQFVLSLPKDAEMMICRFSSPDVGDFELLVSIKNS